MHFAWHIRERREERRALLKALIPKFARLIVRYVLYKRRFPKAFISADSKVIKGAVIGDHAVVRHSVIGANVRIGDCTTIGHQCRLQGGGIIEIGRFCSIAPECFFWSENHRTDRVSTFPFTSFLTGEADDPKSYAYEDIKIGHDVWIGQRCMILAGAEIGHGSVVAAGSVVPRGTYPPYSVIAGVPGRVIKTRLPDDTVEELLALSWWDKPLEDIFGDMLPLLQDEMTDE